MTNKLLKSAVFFQQLKNFSQRLNLRIIHSEFIRRSSADVIRRNQSSVIAQKFEKGQEVSGFKVYEVRDVPEFQMQAIRLNHVRTGADYLHIARHDSNNVFCIGYKTPPSNSKGVPHILEHNVLCGSHKYPCRDPFFKMLNRSLSTFMNAMTGSDYTMYPFSTQNPVDFQNLMSVYLDATLKPNLNEMDFLQEGWRLEHKDLNNKSSQLIFKGVVFNEMKGVFADPQMSFMRKLQNNLLPSHTYGHESGGDPLCIPTLSWSELKEFHAKYYHPSNSRFFTYGDMPLSDHLSFIENHYLKDYEKNVFNIDVPVEIKWETPRQMHFYSSIEPMASPDRQESLAISFALCDIKDWFETFTLSIISELLIGGPNAPFYKSLLESQLGTSFSPSTGYDNHTRCTSFTIGVQGMKEDDKDNVIAAIQETFQKVHRKGFTEERIEAVLHSIELQMKHQTSSFGLNLAMGLNPSWNHGGDILKGLQINENLFRFREQLKQNPNFIQDKIDFYFLQNNHKLILSMSPDVDYEKKMQESEEKLLKEYTQNLTDKEIDQLWDRGHTLKQKQEAEENLSCLPTLKISDIGRNIPKVAIENLKLPGDVPLQVCVQPTNGVSYFTVVLNSRQIPEDLQKYLPLFCNILTKMGAGNFDFKELDHRAELVSGGLASSLHLTEDPSSPSLYEQGIVLSSHCLSKNFSSMLQLWSLIFNALKFDDVARFDTLVKILTTNLSSSLVHGGHAYAMSYAASHTSYVANLRDSWSGFRFLQTMKAISETSDMSILLEDLKKLIKYVFKERVMRVSLNVSSEDLDDSLIKLEHFMRNLDGKVLKEDTFTPIPSNFSPDSHKTHLMFPFPINFASKAFSSVPYLHPDSGPLRVVSRLMFPFLHREIREKGGAYGGGANYTPGEAFKFFSYRDPESVHTLHTFDRAIDWVMQEKFTEQHIIEAKLGIFQKIDAPISPGAKGMRNFLHHLSHEDFCAHRLSVLDSNPENIVRVVKTYLSKPNVKGTCLIGPENSDIEKDNSWKIINH